MSEYDKWEIAAVLPEDFQEFDDWVLQSADLDMFTIEGRIYHRHLGDSKITLYMTSNGKCRDCGAEAPPGILFMARVSKLDAYGVTDAGS